MLLLLPGIGDGGRQVQAVVGGGGSCCCRPHTCSGLPTLSYCTIPLVRSSGLPLASVIGPFAVFSVIADFSAAVVGVGYGGLVAVFIVAVAVFIAFGINGAGDQSTRWCGSRCRGLLRWSTVLVWLPAVMFADAGEAKRVDGFPGYGSIRRRQFRFCYPAGRG